MFNNDYIIKCNSLDEAEDCLNKIEEYFGYEIYKPSEEKKKDYENRALIVFFNKRLDTTYGCFLYKERIFIEADNIFINYEDFLELCKEENKKPKEKDIITDKKGRIIRVNPGNKNTVFYGISNNKVCDMPVRFIYEKQAIVKEYACYISKEACEKALKRQEIHRKLEDLAFELNGNRDITEEEYINENINKYCLYFNFKFNAVKDITNINHKGCDIYCLSKDFKDKAIEIIGEQDLKDYLINC